MQICVPYVVYTYTWSYLWVLIDFCGQVNTNAAWTISMKSQKTLQLPEITSLLDGNCSAIGQPALMYRVSSVRWSHYKQIENQCHSLSIKAVLYWNQVFSNWLFNTTLHQSPASLQMSNLTTILTFCIFKITYELCVTFTFMHMLLFFYWFIVHSSCKCSLGIKPMAFVLLMHCFTN